MLYGWPWASGLRALGTNLDNIIATVVRHNPDIDEDNRIQARTTPKNINSAVGHLVYILS